MGLGKDSIWWMEALGGIVFVAAIQYAGAMLAKRLKKRLSAVGWKTAFFQAVRGPWLLALWTIGIVFVIDVASVKFDFSTIMNYLSPARSAVVVGAVVWLFLRWKVEIQKTIYQRAGKKIDPTTFQIIGKLATIAVFVFAALIMLQLFGIDTAPLLAFGGVGAASIGFAGKDVIANFCSGLILQISRPFVVGDEIALPEKHLEGVIEEIGWFRTTIRDLDKRELYLPNNCFSTMLLVNASRMTHRRLKQVLQIPFEAIGKVGELTAKIKEEISEIAGIDKGQAIHVYLRTFGDWALQLEIEAFSKHTRKDAFNALQQQVLLAVHHVFEGAGVSPAIPVQQTRQLS